MRTQVGLRQTRLCAITGYGERLESGSQSGTFDYHLVKPLNFQRLQEFLVEPIVR